MTIPYIQTNNQGIPIIPTLNGGIRSIRQIGIKQLYVAEIPPSRVWVYEAPQALPIDVPVTTIIGTPSSAFLNAIAAFNVFSSSPSVKTTLF